MRNQRSTTERTLKEKRLPRENVHKLEGLVSYKQKRAESKTPQEEIEANDRHGALVHIRRHNGPRETSSDTSVPDYALQHRQRAEHYTWYGHSQQPQRHWGPGQADLRGASGEARQEGGGAVMGWGLGEDGATSSRWKVEGGCKKDKTGRGDAAHNDTPFRHQQSCSASKWSCSSELGVLVLRVAVEELVLLWAEREAN
ncbi:hypothetical protein B0H13DRAFT_1897164 [Mycena leptocephala]|nr:hypothetical protein B0H13DRAFT_1897164 [Mycena leptocephala]